MHNSRTRPSADSEWPPFRRVDLEEAGTILAGIDESHSVWSAILSIAEDAALDTVTAALQQGLSDADRHYLAGLAEGQRAMIRHIAEIRDAAITR